MSKKQSAVEWLIDQLRGTDENGDFIFNGVITSELIEQAKQMEKQEIKDAFQDGRTWNNSWNEETYFIEVYEKNGRYL